MNPKPMLSPTCELAFDQVGLGDVERLVELLNDARVIRFLTLRIPSPYTAADASEFIEAVLGRRWPNAESPGYLWALRDSPGAICGMVTLEPMTLEYRLNGTLGYWLDPAYWNRGIMSKSLAATTAWCWQHLDLMRIEAGVFSGNDASSKALLNAGYTLESTARRRIFKDDRFYDYSLYVAHRPGIL